MYLLDVALLLCQQPERVYHGSAFLKINLMDFEKGPIKFNQEKLEENKIPEGFEIRTIFSQCVLLSHI